VCEIADDDEEYDQPLQCPEVTPVKQALELVGKLAALSHWQGNKLLAQAISKVNDVLVDMRLKSLLARRQSTIMVYFSKLSEDQANLLWSRYTLFVLGMFLRSTKDTCIDGSNI